MASSQKKSTTNSAKKTTTNSAGKRTAPSSAAKKPASKTSRSQKSEPVKDVRPIRREVGGVICLLLAFFGILTWFKVDALFINLFRDLMGGLVGYGAYAYPPMLLVASYILIFHRGRPVRLRLGCALIFPLLQGPFSI